MTDPSAALGSPAETAAAQTLLDRIVDAREGLDVMVDRAEPMFRHVALKFRETHHQHAERVTAMITALGGEPATGGSFQATVNRTVVSLRAMFEEIDAHVMDDVREGETHVLAAFEDAIAAIGVDRHRAELAQMRGELIALLDETARAD